MAHAQHTFHREKLLPEGPPRAQAYVQTVNLTVILSGLILVYSDFELLVPALYRLETKKGHTCFKVGGAKWFAQKESISGHIPRLRRQA